MGQLKTKTIWRKTKYNLLYALVVTVIRVSTFLPRSLWLATCGLCGKIVFCVAPKLKEQVASHLRLAFKNEMTPPEIRRLTEQAFVMLGKNAGIVLRNFSLSSGKEFRKQVVVNGIDHAVNAFEAAQGVIFLTAHLGPFESVATELSLRGFNPYIVGTPLKDRRLNNLLLQHRGRFGAVVIERGKDTYRLVKNMATGGTMAILIDQDTHVKSVFVDFFGKPCSTPVGAAYMAMKTRAAVIPVFAHLNERGMIEINYYPPIEIIKTGNETADLITNTQRFTAVIENEIRKYPDQWVWMHKRWKTRQPIHHERKTLQPVVAGKGLVNRKGAETLSKTPGIM